MAPEAVVQGLDVKSIYDLPLFFHREGLDAIVLKLLGLKAGPAKLDGWRSMAALASKPPQTVTLAVVGKYTAVQDAYKSIKEALVHGGIANRTAVDLRWVDADQLNECHADQLADMLRKCHGVLVPGGFGVRGIEGKIKAIQYAREHKLPFFGICLGMQCAVTEFARHVAGLKDANSTEFNEETPHPVISLLAEQQGVKEMGGTMRLGLTPAGSSRRPWRPGPTARRSSSNATATATSSTTSTGKNSKRSAWCSAAFPRTNRWWK